MQTFKQFTYQIGNGLLTATVPGNGEIFFAFIAAIKKMIKIGFVFQQNKITPGFFICDG